VTRTRTLIASLVVVAFLASFAANAAAACDSWTNASGGSWATASNWSTGAVPSTTDDVCITLPGTYTVVLAPYSSAGGDSIASLTIGGGEGTQTLDELGAASVTGSNETNNETRLGVTNGVTIASSGALILDATAGGTPTPGQPAGGTAELSAATLVNGGAISTRVEDASFGAQLQVSSITNQAGGSISVGSGALTLTQPSPYSWSAVNNGSISVAAGASLVLSTSFAGDAAFTNDGPVANAGSISMATTSGAATWTQSGGSLSGNAVQLGSSTTLADSAGAGQFLLVASPVITGTIPAGQTVTVGDQTIGTTLSLKNATLVNDGTLVLDQTGTGTTSGGPVMVASGAIQNNGSLVAQVDDPSWVIHLQAGLTNAHGSTMTVAGGSLVQDDTTQTVNDGLVTLGPGALYLLEEGSSFVNAGDGTVSPQIASATSFGQFQLSAPCCAGAGSFTAGGTLLPVLVGGFVPAANQEFQTFLLTGGPFTGTFATLGNGFSADYAHETTSPAYVGSVYGAAVTQTPSGPAPAATTAHVGSIAGGKGMLTVKLSCPTGGGSCARVNLKAAVFEHLRGKRIVSITARAGKKQAHVVTKQVTVGSAAVSLAAGASTAETVKVDAAGRALLTRFHHLAATLTISSAGKAIRSASVSIAPPAKVKPKKKG
jgi:fibronectin-binding autotransporter adhesin